MAKNIMLPEPHEILSIVRETTAEYTFRVEWNKEVPKNGQFFMLSIPKIGEAPISVSGRGDGYVEFTIRKVGRLTDGIFLLDQGQNIFLRGPYGNAFPVEKFENKPLAVIAGGTAVAPVKTTITHFYDHPEICKELWFIAGFKNEKAALFNEERKKFESGKNFHCIYCLDNEEAPGYHKGFVTQYVDQIPFDQWGDDYNVVIVGPPAMMNFTAKGVLAQGVPEDHIWVSFERKMSCAVGKCGHCKIDETYVCVEGPVFNYTRAKDLLD